MSWTLFAISIFLYVSLDFAGHLLLGATQLAVSNVLENLFEKYWSHTVSPPAR